MTRRTTLGSERDRDIPTHDARTSRMGDRGLSGVGVVDEHDIAGSTRLEDGSGMPIAAPPLEVAMSQR
jgi:hypothetical protein